jgi:transmembrane sensor
MDTNKPDLPELIDRYERGDTSLEEDQILFNYFNDKHSENQYDSYRAQFVYFKNKMNELPADVFVAELNQMLKKHRSYRSIVFLVLRVAAVLIVAIGIGWLVLSRANHFKDKMSTGQNATTRLVLPDGTIVFLNHNSEIVYNWKSDDGARTVGLKGEAYFEVQRDTLRPFIIHLGGVTTEVLGTSFNVRYYAHEEATEINVNSGHVLFGADEKITVEKGQGAIHFSGRKQLELVEFNANAVAWRTGKLTFENAKMADVIRDIERYFQIEIESETSSLLHCHFTGEFSNPKEEDVLKVISYSLNIRYTKSQNKYILSGQSCQPK